MVVYRGTIQIQKPSKQAVKELEVIKITESNIQKTALLSDGSSITTSLWSSISLGNRILSSDSNIYVKCKNGIAKILPLYNKPDSFVIGNKTYKVRVKEVESEEELKEQKYLASFHYRNSTPFGRSSKLIIVSETEGTPKVLGYIELTMAPLMNKARNQILNREYDDGHIKWSNWDFQARGKYSLAIVSIARVVTHPEYRGLGISRTLLKHIVAYAKEYWQVSETKPIFIEIVADMLKFFPFVQKIGMSYVGSTEGNIDRIKKDLRYYNKNRSACLAINKTNSLVRMQSHYIKKVIELCSNNKMTFEDVIELIKKRELGILDTKTNVLNGIVRFPKPTYLLGLNGYSEAFLKERVLELKILETSTTPRLKIDEITSPIVLDNVTFSFDSHVNLTERTSKVSEAFGILESRLNTQILSNFSITINPRDIILVTGSSGSGKTSILDLLREEKRLKGGKILIPQNAKIGTMTPLNSEKPIIELIGDTVEESIYILNKSGLSEPNLYLKKFTELSKGQQYRAMIADLISKKCNIWIADEFLSSLDPLTANIVANNLRNLAKKFGITLILASANPTQFIDSLRPDKVIKKSFGIRSEVIENFKVNLNSIY